MNASVLTAISDLDLSLIDNGDEAPSRYQRPVSQGDIGTYVDECSTVYAIDHARMRARLVHLLRRFATEGFTLSPYDEPIRITEASRRAAGRFLSLLPNDCRLPRVSPDGEGGVVLAWDQNERALLVSLQGWTLHFVNAPARSAADYLDDVAFGGETIPDGLTGLIPRT